MPLVSSSDYKPSRWLFNGHVETIYPSLFRKVPGVGYQRERLTLPDGDFVDLDWLSGRSDNLVIISHGLEGSSERHYCKGMARYFHANGWDALAWNCRSCSGEMNRLPRFYHHGDTADLKEVVSHAQKRGYASIVLIGFSMGGSMSLKLLGEWSNARPACIKGGVVFSVPCHLGPSARELDKPNRSFYRNRFLRKLEKKIQVKAKLFPAIVSAEGFDQIQTFEEFDNRYTAPLHHFKNAADFYEQASCLPYLPSITVPVLLVNAKNDPFLPTECYPIDIATTHPYLHLEMPERGGHVGFSLSHAPLNWMEQRAMDFIRSTI